MATATLAFDDFVRGQAALTAPIETEFIKFVAQQEKYSKMCKILQKEMSLLKADNETKDIKLKHVRNSFNEEMKKRVEAEELARQYEHRLSMISQLLCSNDRMSLLNEEEKRSLFNFGGEKSMFEASSIQLSEISVEPMEDDKDASVLRNGTRWTRRRTRSIENQLEDEAPSAKRSSFNRENEEKPVPLPRTLTKPPVSRARQTKVANSDKPEKEMMKKSLSESNFLDITRDIAMEETRPEDDEQELPMSAPSTPTAPPMPEGLYPVLESIENMSPSNQGSVVMSPGMQSPRGMAGGRHGDNQRVRVHSFLIKKVIRPESCQVCQKRIGFGRSAHKCKECRGVCHPGCRDRLALPCVPVASTPRKKNDGDLDTYCPASSPRIPSLVVHCIREVEKRGLSEVGIYRVPGSDVKVKELKEKLLRGKGQPNLSKIDDIHVICSVMKDFIRSLKEPLLTFQLHGAFSLAADMNNEEDALAQILQAIAQLPTPNKDTLAFLVLHLQKVAAHHQSNMMSMESLAKVFGPTIVGHSCTDPEPATIWYDTQRQPKIVQRMMNISEDYWQEYVNPSDQFALITSPDALSLKSPGGSSMGSPSTPENRPVLESPFLGPLHSPVRQPTFKTPTVAPNSVNRKRHGPFFAPIAESNK